jgi:hypothetical protein
MPTLREKADLWDRLLETLLREEDTAGDEVRFIVRAEVRSEETLFREEPDFLLTALLELYFREVVTVLEPVVDRAEEEEFELLFFTADELSFEFPARLEEVDDRLVPGSYFLIILSVSEEGRLAVRADELLAGEVPEDLDSPAYGLTVVARRPLVEAAGLRMALAEVAVSEERAPYFLTEEEDIAVEALAGVLPERTVPDLMEPLLTARLELLPSKRAEDLCALDMMALLFTLLTLLLPRALDARIVKALSRLATYLT